MIGPRLLLLRHGQLSLRKVGKRAVAEKPHSTEKCRVADDNESPGGCFDFF